MSRPLALTLGFLIVWSALGVTAALAAPKAAIVIDARTGEVLMSQDADRPLHPASLTKMMTLYLAFEAVKSGRATLEQTTTVSQRAASRGGSSLHLVAGEQITLRDLILGTAIRSANDAATALAEMIGGSEAAFVAQMNATAARMGLQNTSFRNPHGLTAEGHLTTARDMARLGRFLSFDHPEFYALFARRSVRIGTRDVAHTNRRYLGHYSGADGIKTGYTRAAGYTLTASARRGDKHLIVSVFGANNSAERTQWVSRLMDEGFAQVAEEVTPRPPSKGRAPLGKGPLVAGLSLSSRPAATQGSILLADASRPTSTAAGRGGVALSAFAR